MMVEPSRPSGRERMERRLARRRQGRVEWDMRVSYKKIRWPSQLMQRADKIASDLNVILIVFAVGLATLDLTFLVTQKVIDRLPQVTRVVDAPSPIAQVST